MKNTLLITIEDTAGSMVARARGALANPTRLNRIAADGALPVVQRSLLRMAETNHNRFGVRSSFWNRMNDETYAGSEGEDAFVSMPRPVALRAFGGTVTPKESKYLAIPAVAEAYGSRPRDHDDLAFVLFGNTGKAALVQRRQQSVRYLRRKGVLSARRGADQSPPKPVRTLHDPCNVETGPTSMSFVFLAGRTPP